MENHDESVPVPVRPRLADHVAVRRHEVEGRVVITLHDERMDRVATLGGREWGLLAMADGTREVGGIVAAAGRFGHQAREDHLQAFLVDLAAAGMLAEGPSEPEAEGGDRAGAERPLRALPGFRLRCDGAGTCCRIYPTVTFSPREVLVALALGEDEVDERARFTPARGSERVPWVGRAVAMRDGRCTYLDGARRCRLHAQGGVSAKPLGCRRFPVQLVDDGRELRASVAPECACVFASAAGIEGEPLLGGAREAADLEPGDYVRRIPETVALSASRSVSRDRYLAWSDDLEARLALVEGGDLARWLWREARGLERPDDGEDVPCAPEELAQAQARLRGQIDRRLALAAWRSPEDWAAVLPGWLRGLIDEPLAFEPAGGLEDEAFYLRALTFGHGFVGQGRPVADELRRHALWLLVARRLAAAIDRLAAASTLRGDPALEHPLALVAAYARAFAL